MFFFLPSQLSSLPSKNARNAGEHHCTTRRQKTPIVEHHCTTLQKRRQAPLHYTMLETPTSTGGWREDVPPMLQHPIDEALQNKVKKEREK
jgi:hypothetical protein